MSRQSVQSFQRSLADLGENRPEPELIVGNTIDVPIPEPILRELKSLSQQLNVPPSVALRYAIWLTHYLTHEVEQEGAEVVLKRGDDRFYSVQWLRPHDIEEIWKMK